MRLIADSGSAKLLLDEATGLAYSQVANSDPVLINRSDGYWQGSIPLVRGESNLIAAAVDDANRLRVLDSGPWGSFSWILDEQGMFIGEEGPNDLSHQERESLFQVDLDGDGSIAVLLQKNAASNSISF